MTILELSEEVRRKIIIRNNLEAQIVQGFTILLACEQIDLEKKAFLRKWHSQEIECLEAFLKTHKNIKDKSFESENFN